MYSFSGFVMISLFLRYVSPSTQDKSPFMLSIKSGKFHSPSPDKTKSIKSYSDCFINCNRLDAEYYQPKYDELFALLGAYDTKTLSEIVNIEKYLENSL